MGEDKKSIGRRIISQETLLPLGFCVMLLGGAYAFGQYTAAAEHDRKQWVEFQAQSLQRDAELRSMLGKTVTHDEMTARDLLLRSWVREFRAALPAELRASLPEWPK